MSYQSPAPISLVMRRGPRPNQYFSLHKDVLTVGRTPDNDIVIDDAGVSRHHARLVRHGANWAIEDLGSSNGTFINGQRIGTPVFLTPGSQVGIGPNVLFGVESVAAPAYAPPARGGGSRVLVLGALAALVVLVLGVAAVLAYFYLLKPRAAPVAGAIEAPASASAPFVAFQEPDPDTHVSVGESVLVFATASDPEKITRVELWVDDQLVIQQDGPDPNGVTPFSLIYSLTAAVPGTHPLVVRAYDGTGTMGESPIIHVTVIEEAESPPADRTAMYIAQPGDTVGSVAEFVGVSVEEIQKRNPGMVVVVVPGDVITPSQAVKPSPAITPGHVLQPGQILNVPAQAPPAPVHPPLPKPPAQGPVHPPLKVPGLLPNFPPGQMGAIPGAGPGAMAPAPWILPGFVPNANIGNIINNPKSPVKAPVLVKAEAVKDQCKVTLEWQDNSDEENFLIHRNTVPTSIFHLPIAKMAAGTTKYEDTVPRPDTYVYMVQAVDKNGNFADSNPVQVEVPPSAGCVAPRTWYAQLYFRPLQVNPGRDKYKYGRLIVQVGDTFRRISVNQGQFLRFGDWSTLGSTYLPAPTSFYLNPQEPVFIHINALATEKWPDDGPDYLFAVENSHDVALLSDSHRRIREWKGSNLGWEGEHGGFSITYNVWIESVKWTGKGSTDKLPAPTNLRFAKTKEDFDKILTCEHGKCDPQTTRALVWDYSLPERIDGFVLYRSYTCPGQDTKIMVPTAYVKSWNSEPTLRFSGAVIEPLSEPVGCLARYEVSAYGPVGESPVSAPLDAETAPAVTRVNVTFKDLTISKGDKYQRRIDLFANQYNRSSDYMMITATTTYTLAEIPIEGKMPGNTIAVNLGKEDGLQFGYSIHGICDMANYLLFPTPNVGWDALTNRTYVVESADGVCKVNVEISKVEDVKAGDVARPQTDLDAYYVYQVGNDIYVSIANRGPDDLPLNQVEVTAYWVKPNTKDEPLTQPMVETRWLSQEASDRVPFRVKVGSVVGIDLTDVMKFHVEIKPLDFDDLEPRNNVVTSAFYEPR